MCFYVALDFNKLIIQIMEKHNIKAKINFIANVISLVCLTSCESKINQNEKISGYVVSKEWIKPHWDNENPTVYEAGILLFPTPHVNIPHPSPHVSNNSYSHPVYYGVRPITLSHNEKTWIGSEFCLYVANKTGVKIVSVDSLYFFNIKRGDLVCLLHGKPCR
jgi:hypothetical protein